MNTHGCDHICTNTPGGYNCSCSTGYILNSDSLTCAGILSNPLLKCNDMHHGTLDIDECELSGLGGNCSQVCINTPGSYECQCNIGYHLTSDGFTCEGIKPNNYNSYQI